MIKPTRGFGNRIERRGEIQIHESGEENRPNKQDMDENVDWVAVISAIEGEVPFQIKKCSLPHRILGGNRQPQYETIAGKCSQKREGVQREITE